MSKIIEALQKPKPFAKKSATMVPEDKARSRFKTQSQLADVYFSGPKTGEQAALPEPTIIRVVEKPAVSAGPWVISVLALLLACFTLFSSKKIAVQITVADQNAPEAAGAHVPDMARIMPDAPHDAEAMIRPVIGRSDLPVQIPLRGSDFVFSGAAVLNSNATNGEMTLANSSLSGLANALVHFDPPFQAAQYYLQMEARGAKGKEKLEFLFKDMNGNNNLNVKKILIPEEGLTTQWQPIVVELIGTPHFDANAIEQMRIEFGTQRTANSADATIFVRNLKWVLMEGSAS